MSYHMLFGPSTIFHTFFWVEFGFFMSGGLNLESFKINRKSNHSTDFWRDEYVLDGYLKSFQFAEFCERF